MENSKHIDIIGYSCRLPGAESPGAFWNILRDGRCTVSQIPPDRWAQTRYLHPGSGVKGKSYSFAAGVLESPFDFDPAVFGISPREAEQMDPQQRVLLEVVWEALEKAGLPPSRLAGSNTGVFVGTSGLDYSNRYIHDIAVSDAYFMTGNTLSIVSNRISHVFDLHGPSFTVDTACSSSLVALHQAVQAIQSGEIDTAIVGGVNLLLTPYPFIGFSAATMLSPEGRCRAFDANAEGYVRAEGAVALVLRSAAQARRNGDISQGSIVASGVNSDGWTPGMSLPSAAYQTSLLERLYAETAIDPNDLAFVEAHGTGTRVGDPAEAESLGRILGQKRKDKLPIGSVKTNIGHLEPASGLAGVLKACLALRYDYLPASLHFDTPNPDIPFDELNLQVAGKGMALAPRAAAPRYAGVSSFGFGGTNAHVILSDPLGSAADAPAFQPGRGGMLMLSAKSEQALKDTARQYQHVLEDKAGGKERVSELAAQALAQTDQMEHSLAVLGGAEEQAAALGDFIKGAKNPAAITGTAPENGLDLAFVYSGNGAQWAGMGRIAYEHNRVFRARIDEISEEFEGIAGWPLREALLADDLEERLESAEVAQPLLFACQSALTTALKDLGIVPSAVMGHSVGEVAAAEACGALSAHDALNVIHKRSIHQEIVRGQGTMAAVLLSAEAVSDAIDDSGFENVEIAAINSPRSVTISGPDDEIAGFSKYARRNRIACRAVKLNYPFHSALIEPVKEPLLADLTELKPRNGSVPFVSSVQGGVVEGAALDGNYWWNNVRHAVRFADAAKATAELGCRVFLEVSPRPVLINYLNDTLAQTGAQVSVFKSLDASDAPDADPALPVFARCLTHGAKLERETVFGAHPARNPELPGYPWQRKPFRIPASTESSSDLAPDSTVHPLLGWRENPDATVWNMHLDAANTPWLADHKVNGRVVVPGTALAEMALAAARDWQQSQRVEIRDMDIVQALFLEEGALRDVRLRLSPDAGSFEISSRARLSDDDWQLHAAGRYGLVPSSEAVAPALSLPQDEKAAIRSDIYDLARAFGLDYGPVFQRLTGVERLGEGHLRITLARSDDTPLPHAARYATFPNEFDACFHGLATLYEELDKGGDRLAFVPVRFGRLRLHKPAAHVASAEIHINSASSRGIAADFALYDASGAPVASLEDARFRAASLVKQSHIEQLAYHIAGETIALPGREHDPVQLKLPDIALADGELSDAELLLEAAARRSAYDALGRIANDDGIVSVATDGGEADAHRQMLCNALLNGLEAAGLAEYADESWQLAAECNLPDTATILKTLVADYPAASAACVLLARADALLPGFLSGNTALPEARLYGQATLDHYQSAADHRQTLLRDIGAHVSAIAENWDMPRPLRVLEVGAGSNLAAGVLAPLLRAGRATLCMADSDRTRLERAEAMLPTGLNITFAVLSSGDEVLQAEGPFDIAVSAGNLHALADVDGALKQVRKALVPGGRFIAAEAAPDLYHDLVFGLLPDWFARSADPDFPLSAMRTGEEWQAACDAAGFTGTQLMESGALSRLVAAAPAADHEDEAAAEEDAEEPVLIVTSHAPREYAFAETLKAALATMGREGVLVPSRASSNGGGAQSLQDWDAVVAALPEAARAKPAIICLAGAFGDGQTPPEQPLQRLAGLTTMLQAVGQSASDIWVAAPGGARAQVGKGADEAAQSAIWGYGRVAANEYSDCRLHLTDFDEKLDDTQAAYALARLVASGSGETELVLGDGHATALRAERGVPVAVAGAEQADAAVLDFARAGSLDNLGWKAAPLRAPAPGEVQIEVAASSLNFRDVMWTLGMLPEEALESGFAGPTLGLECAGSISAVGEGVTDFAVGDQVIAFAPACFSTHVTVSSIAVAHLPEELSPVAGATIPVAFFTSYYALHHLARLRQGEWVLIHGGAGGVGLAAIQIAKWRGARIIATAGSDEKRAFLSSLGVDHVLNSRSLDFVDEVMQITGDGVDVVLNSLSGEAMERSLELVRPFGRFLELGKRDYYANTKLALRPFRRNVSYFGIDADQLLSQQPELGQTLFREMVQGFQDGHFSPLPHRVFSAGQTISAFRLMQQSGHIGKIVVTPPVPDEIPAAQSTGRFSANPDGAHIVIGGTGGFGFEAAVWLAACGAKHIVVTSRSAALSGETRQRIDALAETGVSVEVVKSDVTDVDDLEKCLSAIRAKRPISGIVHAAMVLDDVLIPSLTTEQISRVLAPKVQGAYNLDALTEEDDLDYFILFSSATTLVGNPGQANYVAANAWMEGLARKRRAAGKPALAVGWGAITDAGYLTRNREVGDQLSQRVGFEDFGAQKALSLLEDVLSQGGGDAASAVVHIAPVDWSQARRDLAVFKTPLFAHIAKETGAEGGASDEAVDLAEMISGLDEHQARQKIAALLATEVGRILRIPPDGINLQRPLTDIGMDSLMGLELRNGAQDKFGIEIALVSISDGTTLNDIAARILKKMRSGGSGAAAHNEDLFDQHVPQSVDDDKRQKIMDTLKKQSNEAGNILS